ncbi:hypothetical protein S40285_07380 [Stachybotrys chlorohalonatus IBT 40285]|uniref:Uncharacterized protein n=1 Tax=Stachybotrys chlorohalonatus (strain IBT 40285) TaxID=1283841 RepID=A0A084QSA7_STAC4|nr:hypothetical protein S40285_07380 [Stachybotrys chlorohalonata IBT 40285]
MAAGITIDFIPSLDPKGVETAFRLPNKPGQDFRTSLVRTPQSSSSPLTTDIKIVEVHHGRLTYQQGSRAQEADEKIIEESEATLLLFHIAFESRSQDRRYKSALVRFEFFDKTRDERRHPEVYSFAPARTHWLRKTTYDKTTTHGASLGASTGGGPVGGEAGVHWERQTAKTVDSKALIVGRSYLSAGKEREGDNAVEWSMQENKDKSDGVPTFLQAAVLLKRSQSEQFYIKVHVNSNVDNVSKFSRTVSRDSHRVFLRSDEDPIIDDVCLRSGQLQMNNLNITGIKQSDRDHMERLEIDKYWQVNQSEEDVLVGNARAGKEETRERNAQALDDAGKGLPSLPILAERVSSTPAEHSPLALGHTPPPPPPPPLPLSLPSLPINATMAAAEAVAKAAEAAAKAAEAAAKAAEAASHAAGALIRILDAQEGRRGASEAGVDNL